MARKKKYKRFSKKSTEEGKAKSLSDIEKTRRKLQAIEGRELESIRHSAQDIRDLNRAIYELNKNKALIESTYKGTAANKASTWSLRPKSK